MIVFVWLSFEKLGEYRCSRYRARKQKITLNPSANWVQRHAGEDEGNRTPDLVLRSRPRTSSRYHFQNRPEKPIVPKGRAQKTPCLRGARGLRQAQFHSFGFPSESSVLIASSGPSIIVSSVPAAFTGAPQDEQNFVSLASCVPH